MAIQVLNTDSDLTGKTLLTQENAYTISGLHTFSRAPGAPFAVQAGSATVPNLTVGSLSTLASGTVTAPSVPVGAANTGLYSAAANELDLTANGVQAIKISSGQIITSATQPAANATAATQSIASGAFAQLTGFTSAFAQGGIAISSNQYTATVAGIYLIGGYCDWTSNASTRRLLRWMVNGAEFYRVEQLASGSTNSVCTGVVIRSAAANDVFTLQAFQDSGGNLGTAAVNSSSFWIVKVW